MNKLTIVLLFAMIGVAMTSLVSCNKNNDDDSNASIKWIDLGLPSGVLWADRNLGASAPEDIGNYYSWGETSSKSLYWWNTYYYSDDTNKITKYCSDPQYGFNGFSDTLTILEPSDDASTAYLGNGVHTPTKEDWQELMENTTMEFTHNGYLFTALNGNSIYLPITGYMIGTWFGYLGWDGCGFYWSSSLSSTYPDNAYAFFFSGGNYFFTIDGIQRSICVALNDRYTGIPIRAVRHSAVKQ